MDCSRRCLLSDITLALVITSNVIISCHSATTHFYKKTDNHQQKLALIDRKNIIHSSDQLEAYNQNRSLDFIKQPRKQLQGRWNIEPLQIKLDIVIGRYRSQRQEIKELYYGVKGCGLSACPNFNNYIPKPKHEPNTDFFKKRRRHLRKKVHQLLFTFHEGLQRIQIGYHSVLNYENSTPYYNKNRTEILKKLENDIIGLIFELEIELSKGKRGIVNNDYKKQVIFPYPSNKTELLIQEWYVIQGSRRFLKEWKKILTDVMKQTRKILHTPRKRLKSLKKNDTTHEKRRDGSASHNKISKHHMFPRVGSPIPEVLTFNDREKQISGVKNRSKSF